MRKDALPSAIGAIAARNARCRIPVPDLSVGLRAGSDRSAAGLGQNSAAPVATAAAAIRRPPADRHLLEQEALERVKGIEPSYSAWKAC